MDSGCCSFVFFTLLLLLLLVQHSSVPPPFCCCCSVLSFLYLFFLFLIFFQFDFFSFPLSSFFFFSGLKGYIYFFLFFSFFLQGMVDISEDIDVPALCEVSFLSLYSESIIVTLKHGTCESFGAALEPSKYYVFENKTNVSLYSISGCKLNVTHNPSTKISIQQLPTLIPFLNFTNTPFL